MYGDHMDGGWWEWMAIMPVLLVAVVALAVYLAVRLAFATATGTPAVE